MTAKHPWTVPEAILAGACALLGLAITVFAFADIYLTVTHLVAPWFHGWSWTVPLCAEGFFSGTYAGWLLLELRDDPPRTVRVVLAMLLTSFAAASLALNLAASEGAADSVAHGVVVAAFFGYLMFAKIMVRRLTADPADKAMDTALAAARLYAIDVIRAERGRLWRLSVPALLRRNVLTGRLADEVREVITERVESGRTAGWEKAVRTWVLGPDGLALHEQSAAEAEGVRESITRALPTAPHVPPAPAITVPPAAELAAPPNVPPTSPPAEHASKPPTRKMSDDELMALVRPLTEGGKVPSQGAVERATGCAAPRAKRLRDRAIAEAGIPQIHTSRAAR